MVPPQDRPTFQAASSATPNSSILGLPLSITSIASVTTAPSTQPPDTLPRKLPSLSITRLEPTGRGAEPQVSTTFASATPRPLLRQSSAALSMSSSRESISVLRQATCLSRHSPYVDGPVLARCFCSALIRSLASMRVSRDREHGFHCIVSKYFAGS